MALPRVLIVDDEPRNLSLVEALLATFELDVVRASGGREAIDAFAEAIATGGFDLVLLDVMMPDVDGLTALEAMRHATPRGERVPIVLVTALGAREDRIRGLEAGADDFLTKPLDPTEVRCRVRNFLDLRLAQRALRARAEELERLQRAKAELTSMLVHDLKNPLAAMSSNLGWIKRRLAKLGAADVDLDSALVDAQDGAKRLLTMIGNLLEVERAESGTLDPKPKATRLADLLGGVARRHEKEVVERKVEMVVEVDALLEAQLDPELTARVLENLVENATRYTPEGGRIVLAATRTDGGLELAVGNTGQPIPEPVQRTLFEKHASGEKRSRGHHLGLGLYYCRLAAQAHGGDIRVESTPQLPTRFVMTLPEARATSPKPRTNVTAPAPFLD